MNKELVNIIAGIAFLLVFVVASYLFYLWFRRTKQRLNEKKQWWVTLARQAGLVESGPGLAGNLKGVIHEHGLMSAGRYAMWHHSGDLGLMLLKGARLQTLVETSWLDPKSPGTGSAGGRKSRSRREIGVLDVLIQFPRSLEAEAIVVTLHRGEDAPPEFLDGPHRIITGNPGIDARMYVGATEQTRLKPLLANTAILELLPLLADQIATLLAVDRKLDDVVVGFDDFCFVMRADVFPQNSERLSEVVAKCVAAAEVIVREHERLAGQRVE